MRIADDDSLDLHKPFSQEFEVSPNEVLQLGTFLDKKWKAKTPVSFYDLEDYYGVGLSAKPSTTWDRVKLLITCRYIYLHGGMFDNSFWSALVKNGKCPSEALSLCQPLKKSDIYF